MINWVDFTVHPPHDSASAVIGPLASSSYRRTDPSLRPAVVVITLVLFGHTKYALFKNLTGGHVYNISRVFRITASELNDQLKEGIRRPLLRNSVYNVGLGPSDASFYVSKIDQSALSLPVVDITVHNSEGGCPTLSFRHLSLELVPIISRLTGLDIPECVRDQLVSGGAVHVLGHEYDDMPPLV